MCAALMVIHSDDVGANGLNLEQHNVIMVSFLLSHYLSLQSLSVMPFFYITVS